MAGISFSVFRDKIIGGSKRQTIRGIRKNPIKEGETLYMWWKQRSPQREKLGEAKCTNIAAITIREDGYSINSENLFFNSGEFTDYLSLSLMAIADGFKDWQELVEFFKSAHGLPFTGVVIQWDKITNSPYGENFGKPITDTCPCGKMLILDCAGECGYSYSDEDCHECGGTGHHEESIHMPCSSCLGNRKQRR